MVRRDLEADGGFAEFFRRPGTRTRSRRRTRWVPIRRDLGPDPGARSHRPDGPAQPRARRSAPDRRRRRAWRRRLPRPEDARRVAGPADPGPGPGTRSRRPRRSGLRHLADGRRVEAGDPGRWAGRRRGRPGRLTGERGLAPLRAGDRLLADIGRRDGPRRLESGRGARTTFGPGAGRPRRNDGPPGHDRRPDGSTRSRASSCRRSGGRIGSGGRSTGTPASRAPRRRVAELARLADAARTGDRHAARSRASPGSSPSRRPRPAAGASSGCPTGSAGSSCAPGWTASRAT